MPATSSGRIVKSSKKKGGTQHNKNHRWESFTSKLSKFNSLDSLRRIRRVELDAEVLDTTTSYLKNGLEKWQELNLAARYVEFRQEISPMCDSLPQIIHYEDEIFDLLAKYLSEKDRESLEPLLSLLADFAHDLGVRFEKYYAKALEIVTNIAATIQDVEVIEWSFTCLAFMFKYLSKLLVSDLRPTYDIMAPLLGKQRQPPHIARFAAEAMSFLVKKAGAPAVREKALRVLVSHCRNDLFSVKSERQYDLYYHGVMTMFAEAIKGNNMTIHSTGTAVLKSLLEQFDYTWDNELSILSWADVMYGILTSLVHHTNSETFQEVLEAVLNHSNNTADAFNGSQTNQSLRNALIGMKMIGTVIGVRKASRIGDWASVLKSLSKNLEVLSNYATWVAEKQDKMLWESVVLTTSSALQYGQMDALIAFVASFLSTLTKEPLATWFLTFCSYLSEVAPERFQSLVLPYFQRFIVAHWSDTDQEDALCVLLPKMISSGVLQRSLNGKDGFSIPQSWQDRIVSKFEKLEVSTFPEKPSPMVLEKDGTVWHDRCLPKYHALLEILDCTAVHPSTNARIAEILLRKLKLALRPSSALALDESHFIVGRGFHTYIKMIRNSGTNDKTLRPLLHAAAPRYSHLPDFMGALLAYESNIEDLSSNDMKGIDSTSWAISEDGKLNIVIDSLVKNLSTESHELRLYSLRILEHMFNRATNTTSDAITAMLLIEQTPLDLQSARSISMHIRRLASMYHQHTSDLVMSKAIPSFCFGLLTVKLSQTWEDASAALAHISQTSVGEDAVAEIGISWLETPSVARDNVTHDAENATCNGLTDFECSNLMRQQKAAKEALTEVESCHNLMLERFKLAQKPISNRPSNARSQALKVLKDAPVIAERRSRQIVPMFLSWAKHDEEQPDSAYEGSTAPHSDWSRRDQKCLLDLFQLFTNPKVLYRSRDVYSALLVLLCNGDLEIQKSALKALLTWKQPGIKAYEENLTNLLDENRFKDEVTVFLQNETQIQPHHRSELIPVLLRLLYGRTIAKRGAGSGKQGMEGRRLTVIRNLSLEDTGAFLDIGLGELNQVNLSEPEIFDVEILNIRKQLGFVRMMEDVLKELGNKVNYFTPKLLPAILYCAVYASRKLYYAGKVDKLNDDIEDGTSQDSLFKVVRQSGLKCLNLLFQNDSSFEWSPFLPTILNELIRPRLDKLPIETGQAVSGILQIFFTWSSSPMLVLILGQDKDIIPQIANCLAPPKSKDSVKLFVLGIIRNILSLAKDGATHHEELSAQVKSSLLDTNMDNFLLQIGSLLRKQHDIGKDLLESSVETVSELADLVSRSTQAYNLVDISVFLLGQPSRRVNPKTKSGLLKILEHFVPLYELQDDKTLKDSIYSTITSLFGFFRDKASREVLSRVLSVYSSKDPIITEVAEYCLDINSFVQGRLEEPDYDRRLKAFSEIIKRQNPFTAYQWRALLYNMIYFVRQDEEFGILASNASDGIGKFLSDAKNSSTVEQQDEFRSMISAIILPALYNGAREPSEVVRREHLKVMAHLVRTFPEWELVNDMSALMCGEDELESSFFNNILAVGKGRQFAALHLLSGAAEANKLSSRNVSQFFIPLIEHFIFDRAEGSDAHNLAAEATSAVALLSRCLEWPQYRAMLRRYVGYISAKPELEKQIIRLAGKVIDSLAAVSKATIGSGTLVDGDQKRNPLQQSPLGVTLPGEAKFTEDITTNLLPPLLSYIHDKDETTVSLRVPVAVIVVRLLQLLPEERMYERLPAVLTDICHILRSKAQESRDMARDTLTKICELLGPSCFGFVLKELRSALARGYQLHVLSYTMHSILVATVPNFAAGDLDYCLPTIVAVIMDDIFGVTGQEKDAEEYVSKMKEVKSSKSHDSMELIARTASLNRLIDLIRPVQVLLSEKLTLKIVRKIDELLSRISSGLLRNPAVQSRDSLIFCYEVIQGVYNSTAPPAKPNEDRKLKRFLLKPAAEKSGNRGSTTMYTHKLIKFALDVLRAVLRKYDDLSTSANLTGFLPIIGDCVVHPEDEVKVAAFRLVSIIVKVPLKSAMDAQNLFHVTVREAVQSINMSSSMFSDIAQAALKLISVMLRDQRDVSIKDTALDDLLSRIKDDITDPERRHVIFNFIRAVLESRIETAVLYDVMDYVGTVMVTNDDKDTRDLARGAYFHFLREYPQKKNRWSKQLAFIVANLKYEREGGRLSILEVIHLLLSKSSDEYVQEVSATCFIPLVFVLVNDESEKCRMVTGELVKEIFRKADKEKMQSYLALLRSWLQQIDNSSVLRLAFQGYGFYYESKDQQYDSDTETLMDTIQTLLEVEEMLSDWELVYAALQVFSTLASSFPSQMLASNTAELWHAIHRHLSYPHVWVKLSASKLVNLYFTDFAKTHSQTGLGTLPLRGSNGLELSSVAVRDMIRRLVSVFQTPGLTELLANEAVKGTFFLTRLAAANDLKWDQQVDNPDGEVDEGDDAAAVRNRTAIEHIFGRLSYIIRRETSPPRAPALIPKTAALQSLQLLCGVLDRQTLITSLRLILIPLNHLTDPNIPVPYSTDALFRNGYDALKTTSAEVMSILQNKCGTADYTEKLLKIRQEVKEKRAQRSSKRKIEAVAAPEKYGRDKQKKVERKKEKRKERNLEHRNRRKGY